MDEMNRNDNNKSYSYFIADPLFFRGRCLVSPELCPVSDIYSKISYLVDMAKNKIRILTILVIYYVNHV